MTFILFFIMTEKTSAEFFCGILFGSKKFRAARCKTFIFYFGGNKNGMAPLKLTKITKTGFKDF